MWAQDRNRYFSTEGTQIANKPVKRRSTLLIVREVRTKIAVRYRCTPIRMAIIKNKQINPEPENGHIGEDVENRKLCEFLMGA